MRHLITLLLIISFFISPSFSYGGWVKYLPATEWTQIRNNVELVLQVLEQIKTYKKLIDQYRNMLENTESLEELFWSEGMDSLVDLADALDKDGVIAYSAAAIEELFNEQYPGYGEYLKMKAEEWTPKKVAEFYEKWKETSRNNITGALEAINKHHEDFATEETLIDSLKIQAATPIGRKQALQTANEIAVEQLRQMQRLRQMIMTQINLQANYLAVEQDKNEARDAHEQVLIEKSLEDLEGYIEGDGEEAFKSWRE